MSNSTTFLAGTTITHQWLNDVNSGIFNAVSGTTGAVTRTVLDKLSDIISVKDFGAVGNGIVNDTVAIQAAFDSGKAVYFPTGVYNITSAISVGYAPVAFGERSVSTIIRRTSGAGAVFDFAATNETSILQRLRIGGIGSTGITVAGGGYTHYLATMHMDDVHFENDLLVGINVDLISSHFSDCSWGYFQQTSGNANFQSVVSSFSGTNFTNVNQFDNCRFVNGGSTVAAVDFTSGSILTFNNCAWENNGRDLRCSNVTNVVLNNAYTERGKHTVSQFDFSIARTRTKIIGGQFNGGTMPAGASMFRSAIASKMLVEDADISVTASAFTYQKADDSSHTPPTTGEHQFRNNRVQGNAADPLLWMDNLTEGAPVTWSPSPTNVTVVNGTGGVTYTGRYTVVDRQVFFNIRIVVTGTATTATTAVSFFGPISGLPLPQHNAVAYVASEDGGSQGNGWIDSSTGRFWLPTWGAKNANINISGSFLF